MSGFVVQGLKSDYRDSSGLKNRLYPKVTDIMYFYPDVLRLSQAKMARESSKSPESSSLWFVPHARRRRVLTN